MLMIASHVFWTVTMKRKNDKFLSSGKFLSLIKILLSDLKYFYAAKESALTKILLRRWFGFLKQ